MALDNGKAQNVHIAARTWVSVGTGPTLGIDWPKWLNNWPLDPMLLWADVTGFTDLDRRPSKPGDPKTIFYPVLMEFAPPLGQPISKYINIVRKLMDSSGTINLVQMPGIYWNTNANGYQSPLLGKTRFVSAQVLPQFFALFTDSNTWTDTGIKRIMLSVPVDTDDISAALATQVKPSANIPVADVVVGVIDDGLAFSNGNVRGRITHFWDQDRDLLRDPLQGNPKRKPVGFNYGTEYGFKNLTSVISNWENKAAPGNKPLDEERVYALARLTQLRRRVTHGSAVMSLATRGLSNPAIVCVQLPATTTQDTSGSSLGSYVIDALHYILSGANAIAKAQNPVVAQLPIVANLSYGDTAGPHDGTSMLEEAMDDFVDACKAQAQPFGLVIPAGNTYESRCHARFSLPAGGSQALRWRVHPDDMTASFMEIWIPYGSNPIVSVLPPGEQTAQDVRAGEAFVWPDSSAPTCTIVFPKYPANSGGVNRRGMVSIAIAPTAALASRALAPSGTWTVTVKCINAVADIDAWIQRDDSPYGYPRRGRQSYFDDPNYVRFGKNWKKCEDDSDRVSFDGSSKPDSYVKRSGTLNAIATGKQTIVPGGYRASDGKPARYSSSGPANRTDKPEAPLLAQVSEDSNFHHGVLAGGTHSGSATAFGGTSIAAPQVANRLAEILAAKSAAKVEFGPPFALKSHTPQNPLPPGAVVVGPVFLYSPPLADTRLGLGKLAPPDPPPPPNRPKRAKRREV